MLCPGSGSGHPPSSLSSAPCLRIMCPANIRRHTNDTDAFWWPRSRRHLFRLQWSDAEEAKKEDFSGSFIDGSPVVVGFY